MNLSSPDELLARAKGAYREVVADPSGYRDEVARLVTEARESGATEALVLALRAQAWSERARLENGRAMALLAEAAGIARRHQLRELLGEVLVTRAAVNHELGFVDRAQRDLRAASGLSTGLGARELEFQQAALYQNVGRLSAAAALYRPLLADPRVSVAVRAKSANNLALIDAQTGHLDEALVHIDLAAELAAAVGPHVVAIAAQSRGWVMVQSGRLADSLRQFEVAAALYAAAGMPLGEAYLEYVDALVDLRLLPEARDVAGRAVKEFQEHGAQLMAAEGQLRVARLAVLLHDYEQAAISATDAEQRFRRQNRPAWAARAATTSVEARVLTHAVSPDLMRTATRAAGTLDRLGLVSYAVDAHLAAGRVAIALGRASVAVRHLCCVQTLAARAPVLVRIKARIAAALCAQLQDSDREVLKHCRAGLADLARHRAAFASTELRVRASAHGAELGRLGLEVVLRSGSAADALAWMERTRAAALVAVEPIATYGVDEELATLRATQAELVEARLGTGGEPAHLLARQAAIEHKIRRLTWTRTAPGQSTTEPTSPATLRTLLDGRILVEYAALGDRLFAAILGRRRTHVIEVGSLSTITRQASILLFCLRRLARMERGSSAAARGARTGADAALGALRAGLLDPLGLPPDHPLVIIPIGALQQVPWSALRDSALCIAPSASFWAATAQRRDHVDGDVVLIAGPYLPGAVREVAALRDLYAASTVLVPPASTVGAVNTALSTAALAHLACHGRLRTDNPAFSALELSDGFLTVQELEVRGIAPHRIVLAACDSAADSSYEGNEVFGFVSALIARGTNGVVASTVVVPDDAAVSLMRSLHIGIAARASLGDALFAARREMDLDEPADYVSWCAFNSYGAA